MATTQVLHGRREGQIRGTMGENPVSIIPSGIDAHEVTVLQPNDWKRIQDVLSKTNYEAQRQEAVKKEREELHNISKNMVKNWGNTIEGQRLKKLEARKIKEDKEEEEKKLTDIEEAKFQAQKRKEAIERAKTLQYHKTDRVKGFHSALLLTEVLRERDAQVKMKSNQAEATKSRDDYLIEVQRKQYEEGVLQDQEKALKRYNARQKISEFQKLQVNEKDEKKIEEKELDFAEGANIKEQVAMYKAAKQTIVDQRRQQKRSLMDSHKKTMRERQMYMEKERQKDEEENEEIRQFASAKKKMSKMRKEKEVELFNTFQEQTERMRSKLAVEMKQKVDDEDDRLVKAVTERDDKMAKEEQVKQDAELISRKSIHQHRIDTIKEKERKVTEDLDMDKHLLKLRIESDEKHKKEEEIKLTVQRGHAKKLQNVHEGQMNEKVNRKKGEVKENLNFDHENSRLMAEEEKYFQDYASRVLSEQKIKDPSGNHFPLIKAADEGPGGGRGPRFEGKSGYRPSYIVCDSTGVQLPNYSQETAARSKIQGRPGQSFKRLGLNW